MVDRHQKIQQDNDTEIVSSKLSKNSKSSSNLKTSYPPVEAIRRGLLILRELNQMGISTISDLHKATGLHKATIVRILETLISENYVVRDDLLGGYCITSEVNALSEGYAGNPRLVETSRERLIELTEEINWPISLATIDDDHITLIFTTSSMSVWSYPFNVIGRAMDITRNALGQICLAYCSDHERKTLIYAKCEQSEDEYNHYLNEVAAPIIEKIREDGYAISDLKMQTRHQFVAVPLMNNGEFVAAMCAGFYMSAVPTKDIYESLVVPMQKAARKMEQSWLADK
ncbi:MAG: helix-turn-helix domain-containing protein [Alphaproteobacteria bacterium]|nr:helix-turn-helix domain-containing protein [Alphaproteobacteria bacterium]